MVVTYRDVENFAKELGLEELQFCAAQNYDFKNTPKGSESLINLVQDCASENPEKADQIVILLMEQGAPIDPMEALCKAVGQDLVQTAGILLEQASNEDLLKTFMGQPLLFLVDSVRMLNLLVSSGKVEVAQCNQFGDSFLHYLAENINFNEPLFDILIKALGVNVVNSKSQTPVMVMCESYFTDPEETEKIFNKFIQAGADLTLKDSEGRDFLSYAKSSKVMTPSLIAKSEEIYHRQSRQQSSRKKMPNRQIFF